MTEQATETLASNKNIFTQLETHEVFIDSSLVLLYFYNHKITVGQIIAILI